MVVLKCVLKKSGAAFAGTVPGITMTLVLSVGSLDSLLMVIFMIIFISLIF